MLIGSSQSLFRTCRRCLATVSIREPASGGPHLALPLAFLSARWGSEKPDDWTAWIDSSAQQGYASLSITVEGAADTPMQELTADLRHAIRRSSSPFPPLLFARGAATVVAQDYVSSNPLSGLVLVDPPLAVKDVAGLPGLADEDEFNFEPFFPIALLGTTSEVASQLARHRLRCDFADDVELLAAQGSADPLSKQAFELVLRWMDARGL